MQFIKDKIKQFKIFWYFLVWLFIMGIGNSAYAAFQYNCGYDGRDNVCYACQDCFGGGWPSIATSTCDAVCENEGYVACSATSMSTDPLTYPGDTNFLAGNNYIWQCDGTTKVSNYYENACSVELTKPNTCGDSYRDRTLCICTNYKEDFDSVEVIDLPEINENIIQVGNETFEYDKYKVCAYNKNPELCKIRIFYSYDDIGDAVWLLPDGNESLDSAVDSIAGLSDQLQLYDELIPTIRYATSTDLYNIFKYDYSQATGTLYTGITVKWLSYEEIITENLSSSTDSNLVSGGLMGAMERMFPLSIILQIKRIFDFASVQESSKIDINLDDIVLPEYAGVTATGTLLKADLITTNLPIWNDKIYPAIQMFLWFLTFIYTILRMRNYLTSDTDNE